MDKINFAIYQYITTYDDISDVNQLVDVTGIRLRNKYQNVSLRNVPAVNEKIDCNLVVWRAPHSYGIDRETSELGVGWTINDGVEYA